MESNSIIFNQQKYVDDLINKMKSKYSNKIKVVTGLRFVGKTYLLDKLLYGRLINDYGASPDSFIKLYFTREDRNIRDYYSLLNVLKEKTDENTKYLILDEVQEVNGYDLVLKEYHLLFPNIQIFITGSNSHILSSDIVHKFKEDAVEINLKPLSYSDIKEVISSYTFDDYLKYGGIPSVVLADDKEDEISFIYNQIYQLDILDRFKSLHLKHIGERDVTYIIDNIFSSSSPFSFHKVLKYITKGIETERDDATIIKREIEDFISILVHSYLIIEMDNICIPSKANLEAMGINKKFYGVDNGLSYYLCKEQSKKYTISLETAVFMHLYKKEYQPKCCILISNDNKEIDFAYGDNYVQVCYALVSGNRDREIGNLLLVDEKMKKHLIYHETEIEKEKNITYHKAENILESNLDI